MGLWSFTKPEATTNLISNPSVETATTGYTAVGGAIARSTSYQTKGLYSLEITPGVGVNDGVYYAITLVAATEYTFSVDVLGVTGIPYRIYLYDTIAPGILGTPVTFTGDGTWRRYIVTATTGANTACRVYVEKNNHASVGAFYIDALQVEAKGYMTTYCDGDQDGCTWAAGEHTSTSSRSAQSSAGGRVIDLDSAGYEFEVKSSIGVGHAPIEIIDTLPAQSDGGDFQDQVARPRDFQLVGAIPGTDRADYHLNRLNLIEAVNPHRLATKQPIQLRYSVSEKSVAIDGYYAGGLEKNQQAGPTIEEIALRFKAEDPLFQAVTGHNNADSCGGQGAISASVRNSVANADYIVMRDNDGTWQAVQSGLNNTVRAMTQDNNGSIWIGGVFTQSGLAQPLSRIAKWDGNFYSEPSSGVNNEVRALAIGVDGEIYAGGLFTQAGPVPTVVNYIAEYDEPTSTWSALGVGLNGIVHAMIIGPDGTLYVGGTFTDVSGGPGGTYNYIIAWDGAAWSALGTGMNNIVYSLAIGPDGKLYAGGLFTTAGGNAANRVAVWDGSTWAALGTGMDNNSVAALEFGPDGRLYAGGSFTAIDGVSFGYIAVWNGSTWAALGTGLNAVVDELTMDGNILYVGGNFTTAGGLTLPDKFARWDGSSWFPADVNLPGVARVYALLMTTDFFFVGYDQAGSAIGAGVTTATNSGSANAYPVAKFAGPGAIYQLVNYTTGEQIYFDNLILLDGETVVLDLRPGKKTFTSSFRANIINTILEGSDTELFHLMPGDNSISLFIDDATASAFLLWDVLHWSIDGVAA